MQYSLIDFHIPYYFRTVENISLEFVCVFNGPNVICMDLPYTNVNGVMRLTNIYLILIMVLETAWLQFSLHSVPLGRKGFVTDMPVTDGTVFSSYNDINYPRSSNGKLLGPLLVLTRSNSLKLSSVNNKDESNHPRVNNVNNPSSCTILYFH